MVLQMPPASAVLAFNDPWHDSSFCIYRENEIVHVESERHTRRRFDYINPILTFCQMFPDRVEEFFHIAVEESPISVCPFFKKLVELKSAQNGTAPAMVEIPYGDPWLQELDGFFMPVSNDTDATRRFVRHLLRPDVEIFFCGHHAAHAANAFLSSQFSSALAVTLDGHGIDFDLASAGNNLVRAPQRLPTRRISGGVYRCTDDICRPLFQLADRSFGLAWNRVAVDLLGLAEGSEGTAMAMAALGDPGRFRPLFEERWLWLPPDADGIYKTGLSAEDRAGLAAFMEKLKRAVTGDRERYDLAAALQAQTETHIRRHLERFIIPGETRHLCIAGGVFLNCQVTGKIREWFPFLHEVYIPPAPYDGGLPIGMAQLVRHFELRTSSRPRDNGLAPFALGKPATRLDVVGACRSAQVAVRQAEPAEVLGFIRDGEIVGLFHGAAESGRRALGYRSIIADPSRAGLKDRLNAQIKHREWFRPFAPMVLAEHAGEWFECGDDFKSPYMSFAVPVRPAMRERIPAVVHIDGTARVQTVHRELTPRLYAFLAQWHAMSGIPILLNTSFNDREPIVETPADALNTLRRTPLYGVYFLEFEILARNLG
jgi:carbamoyltransferase